jgi:hypothetical protein
MASTKSKARQKFRALEAPHPAENFTTEEREKWFSDLVAGFVQPSKANKAYYKVVAELLWPDGHGIPGPHVTESDIRSAINRFRKENDSGKDPRGEYVDVFRRVRELQGEEGLTGVARGGKTYQLVDLAIGPKRVPRTKLSDQDWEAIKKAYKNKCAVCGKKEPNVRFQQDHKIPRTRTRTGDGAGDETKNWQPLCDECNNFKSVSCRGCELDCTECAWAFPEKYKPPRFDPKVLAALSSFCQQADLDPDAVVKEAILKHLEENANG